MSVTVCDRMMLPNPASVAISIRYDDACAAALQVNVGCAGTLVAPLAGAVSVGAGAISVATLTLSSRSRSMPSALPRRMNEFAPGVAVLSTERFATVVPGGLTGLTV